MSWGSLPFGEGCSRSEDDGHTAHPVMVLTHDYWGCPRRMLNLG